MNYKKIVLIIIPFIMGVSVYGQFPGLPVIPSPPTPSSMPRYDRNMYGPKDPTPGGAHVRPTPQVSGMDMYERDRMEVERRNQMMMQEMDEDIRFFQNRQMAGYLIENGFPSQMGYPGTDVFQSAYDEISGMLDGSVPMDIGRALFLTENAYLGGTLDYGDFEREINERVRLC